MKRPRKTLFSVLLVIIAIFVCWIMIVIAMAQNSPKAVSIRLAYIIIPFVILRTIFWAYYVYKDKQDAKTRKQTLLVVSDNPECKCGGKPRDVFVTCLYDKDGLAIMDDEVIRQLKVLGLGHYLENVSGNNIKVY